MLDSGGRDGGARAAVRRASACLLFPTAVLDRRCCRCVASVAVAVAIVEEED